MAVPDQVRSGVKRGTGGDEANDEACERLLVRNGVTTLWPKTVLPIKRAQVDRMLVTPKVRRVFRDAGVTSFDWLPIRVEEDGA